MIQGRSGTGQQRPGWTTFTSNDPRMTALFLSSNRGAHHRHNPACPARTTGPSPSFIPTKRLPRGHNHITREPFSVLVNRIQLQYIPAYSVLHHSTKASYSSAMPRASRNGSLAVDQREKPESSGSLSHCPGDFLYHDGGVLCGV